VARQNYAPTDTALTAGAVAKSKIIDDTPVRQAINHLEQD